jgi:predicted nucleic acid-binding protein
MTDLVCDFEPRELRTLDAVHLGAALALGSELDLLMTYDSRLRNAALAQGLEVESPS